MKRLLAVVLALSLVFSMTTVVASADEKMWETSAVTDWYNDEDNVFTISTAEELAGLAKLVDEGNTFAGKTIKLGANIDLKGALFDPIGDASSADFSGTFDGNGKTILNLRQDCNSKHLGLFGAVYEGTVKNLVLDGALIENDGSGYAGGIASYAGASKFENITLKNCTVVNYNHNTGGIVAWCSNNGTTTTFDGINIEKSTTIGSWWGSYDTRVGGIVGAMNTGNNVVIKNSTVACRLDVYNDATSNYQWYNYRTAGMVVADVRDTQIIDGRTEANPVRVTCENVQVIFGDWANYHYCESKSYGTPSYASEGEYKFRRVEAGLGYGGIDISACNHAEDETHNQLLTFDFLFGARDGKGEYGINSFKGVTVKYHVHKYAQGVCVECGQKDENYVAPTVPTVDTTKPAEKVEVGIATATIDAANEVLEEVTKEVLDSVAKGEEVTNVSAEAVKAIQDAINDQHEIKITTKVVVTPVKEDDADKDDVKLILKAADGSTVAQYFDLSVIMTVVVDGDMANAVTSEVTDLNGKKITFTIAIPEELKDVKDGYTREFYVIRVHGDATTKLEVTDNGDGTLSFETDKFSTYALAYTDTENPKAGDANTNKGTPGTGDTNNMMPWLALMVMAAVGAAVVFKRREN